MPTLNPPPTVALDLALVTQPLKYTFLSRQAEVTFALWDTIVGAHTPIDVANAFQTAFNAHITPIFDNQLIVEPPVVKEGDGTTTVHVGIASGAAVNGGRSLASTPPNVACIVKKTTALAGRKNRGRTYYPWMFAQAEVGESGNVDAAFIASYQANFDAFLAALLAANVRMVIANKTLGGSPPHVTAIGIGPDVTSYKIEATIATQRRRVGR